MIDARYAVAPVIGIVAAAAASGGGAVSGATIDMQGNVGAAVFFRVTEATGLTTLTCKLQESDDGSTWADCGADDVVGEADDDTTVVLAVVGVAKLSYAGIKRYVKGVATPVATDVDFNLINVAIPAMSKTLLAIPGN